MIKVHGVTCKKKEYSKNEIYVCIYPVLFYGDTIFNLYLFIWQTE